MPVIGFDDERVRDAWVEEEVQRAVWFAVHGEPAEGTVGAALEELHKGLMELAEAVVEAFQPLLEVFGELAEAARREIERVWKLIKGAGEVSAGRCRGPRHYNCRWADRSPLPVERVDPVRAGRARWWTRK